MSDKIITGGDTKSLFQRRFNLLNSIVIDNELPPLDVDLISIYGRTKGYLNVNVLAENIINTISFNVYKMK